LIFYVTRIGTMNLFFNQSITPQVPQQLPQTGGLPQDYGERSVTSSPSLPASPKSSVGSSRLFQSASPPFQSEDDNTLSAAADMWRS
jgi:hypothetical protein